MYANEYLPVQLLELVLLCLSSLAAYATSKNKAFSFMAVYGIAAWFLVSKIAEYSGSGAVPMDISAICYFLFGFGALLPIRPLKIAVGQLAALCGLVFGVVMICAPQIFAARDPNEFTRFLAISNHALLFFGGLSMMLRHRFRWTDIFFSLALLGAIIVYTEICVAKGVFEGNAVFSKIIDGTIILLAAPSFSMPWWYYVLYYFLAAVIYGLWIAFTYLINRRADPKTKTGIFAV